VWWDAIGVSSAPAAAAWPAKKRAVRDADWPAQEAGHKGSTPAGRLLPARPNKGLRSSFICFTNEEGFLYVFIIQIK